MMTNERHSRFADMPDDVLMRAFDPAFVAEADDQRSQRGPKADRIYRVEYADGRVIFLRSPYGKGDRQFIRLYAMSMAVEISRRFLKGRPALVESGFRLWRGPVLPVPPVPRPAQYPEQQVSDFDLVVDRLQRVEDVATMRTPKPPTPKHGENQWQAGFEAAMAEVRVALADYEHSSTVAKRIESALNAVGIITNGFAEHRVQVSVGSNVKCAVEFRNDVVSFGACDAIVHKAGMMGERTLPLPAPSVAEWCRDGRVPRGWHPNSEWLRWAEMSLESAAS